MTWHITYAAEALVDLDDLYFYVASNLKSPQAAKTLVAKIIDKANSLETFPLRFARYGISPLMERGIRFVSVKDHLIFYLPDEAKHEVFILRILYGGIDVVSRFSAEEPNQLASQADDSSLDVPSPPRIRYNADISKATLQDGRLIVPPSWRDEDDD